MQNMQVKEVLLVVSVLLLVLLLAVNLTHCTLTLRERRRGAYVDVADANGDGVVSITDMSQFLDNVEEDGSSEVTVDELKSSLQKVERLHRERQLSPRTKRSR